MTEYGEIPIENIKPGIFVLGKEGLLNQVTATWSTLYSGEMIKADDLEMTPDHLLFTDRGWIAAHLLKNGNNIVSISRNIKSFSFIKSVADNFPPEFDKKCGFFRVLLFLFRGSVPVPAIDFNGELYILKSKIDIKYFDGKIGDRLFTAIDQGIIQHPLIGRPELSGIELRYGGLVFIRLGSTPDGIVCGASVRLPSVGVTSDMAFVNCRQLKTKADEIRTDSLATNAKNFRYLVYREIFVSEQVNESFVIKNNSSTHNSAIVYVGRRFVKDVPVYNLTVNKDHTFFANGKASHNCLCRVQPRLMDRREFVDDLTRWGAGANVPYLDTWKRTWYDRGVGFVS